jgi:hypothetical protein
MDSGLWWLLVGVAVVLVATVLAAVATTVSATRARRRLAEDLAAARDELVAVQRRVEGLARKSPAASSPQEFVITTAGTADAPAEVEPGPPAIHQQPTARQFASVALGESLVTLASFGYGVRRALSPENRNRIAFEMRREVRRARKQRRRDLKEAKRHLRAQSLDEDAA